MQIGISEYESQQTANFFYFMIFLKFTFWLNTWRAREESNS